MRKLLLAAALAFFVTFAGIAALAESVPYKSNQRADASQGGSPAAGGQLSGPSSNGSGVSLPALEQAVTAGSASDNVLNSFFSNRNRCGGGDTDSDGDSDKKDKDKKNKSPQTGGSGGHGSDSDSDHDSDSGDSDNSDTDSDGDSDSDCEEPAPTPTPPGPHPTPPGPNPIPEPATLLLLGTGLAGVMAGVRNRRKPSDD